MKHLLPILIAVIFFEPGAAVPESLDITLLRSGEIVFMHWDANRCYDYHDVGAGAYTLYPDGRMVWQGELEGVCVK